MQDHVLYTPFLNLADAWREEGRHQLERYGDEGRAEIYRLTATDLIRRLRALPDLEVGYGAGDHLSVWTRGTIRNKVSRGELTNVGTRGHPRLLLRSLALSGEQLFELPDRLLED